MKYLVSDIILVLKLKIETKNLKTMIYKNFVTTKLSSFIVCLFWCALTSVCSNLRVAADVEKRLHTVLLSQGKCVKRALLRKKTK